MLKPSREQIQAVMQQKGYTVFNGHKPYDLNIVGIRNKSTIPNFFDDTIAVFYRNEYNHEMIEYFPATTDPGLFWLQHPMHFDGTAIMCEGQYLHAYSIGRHKGYKALEQAGPILFIRDYNRNNILDFNLQNKEKTIIKANIHRASNSGISVKVDKWSAGCQVLSRGFDYFMELCDLGRIHWGNHFSYTLLNQKDFEDAA
jgi:hypothetical protein